MLLDLFEKQSLILSNKLVIQGESFLYCECPFNSFFATMFDKLVHTSTNLSITILITLKAL